MKRRWPGKNPYREKVRAPGIGSRRRQFPIWKRAEHVRLGAYGNPLHRQRQQRIGVLIHAEDFKRDAEAIMVRASYRADVIVRSGDVLVFTEHDGTLIELSVKTSSTDGRLELGPENASDFAVAFGFQ